MARIPDLIDELRHRKVFRLAAMYAVAGWIVLQIGEVTFEPLGIGKTSRVSRTTDTRRSDK